MVFRWSRRPAKLDERGENVRFDYERSETKQGRRRTKMAACLVMGLRRRRMHACYAAACLAAEGLLGHERPNGAPAVRDDRAASVHELDGAGSMRVSGATDRARSGPGPATGRPRRGPAAAAARAHELARRRKGGCANVLAVRYGGPVF